MQMKAHWKKLCILGMGFCLGTNAVLGAEVAKAPAASLTVTVQRADGQPAPGAKVAIVGRPWTKEADETGKAEFFDLPPGFYVIQATDATGSKASARVELAPNARRSITLALEAASFHEEVTVTGVRPERRGENPLALSVLADDALQLANSPSLGETLRGQLGVRSTFYSPGASRPLIRGMGGDRIRIFENEQELGDASDTSPDHAVAMDTWSADRIEVLRGPMALLYASDVAGGVVNMQGPGVPHKAPGRTLGGWLGTTLSSNPWQRLAVVSLEGQQGSLAWNVSGTKSRSEDYRSAWGKVANSFTQNDQATIGLGLFRPWGFIGLAWDQHERRYGSPVEEEVSVDLWRRRVQTVFQLFEPLGIGERLEAKLTHVDYHHVEIEGVEVGTFVKNRLTTGRMSLDHKPILGFHGTLGGEFRQRTLDVQGDESYLPRTETHQAAIFLWEQRQFVALRWDLGLRWERIRQDPKWDLRSRQFSFPSFSTSFTWNASPWLRPYVSVSFGGKAPNPEELYSRGPHRATGLFEVGDPSLRKERSTTAELGLLLRTEAARIQINTYVSRFKGFIYPTLTGEVEDDLPLTRFTQDDAHFWGTELELHWDLLHQNQRYLELLLMADLTQARLTGGRRLPRVPPFRTVAELALTLPQWRAALTVERTLRATRIAPEETKTPGFTAVGFSISKRFVGQQFVHAVNLKGANLTDAKALNHTSFFKEKSPLPGRSLSLSYQLWF